MAVLDGHVRQHCSWCGERMKVGERVDVALSFETQADLSGSYITAIKKRARSVKVCRKCAFALADEHRMSLPREIEELREDGDGR